MTTIHSLFKNSPKVLMVAIGRINRWNKLLITLAPKRWRACVIADLQGTRQYLATFNHFSDIPSIRFLSISHIEYLDQKLIVINKQTTNWAGKERFLFSFALRFTIAYFISDAGIAVSIALNKSLFRIFGDNNEKPFRCTTAYPCLWN